jgi:predicted HAD superfamily Cof-like phosphohydrolase
MTNFQKIKEFHRVFGRTPDPTEPDIGTDGTRKLRATLVFEEFKELLHELGFKLDVEFGRNNETNRVENYVVLKERSNVEVLSPRKIAKETADLLVVTYGTAASLGIDIDKAYDEVHASNMSKLDENGNVVRREDGKVLKGPLYKPPSLEWLPEIQSKWKETV